jgi:chromosome segregation ATPase
MIITQLEITNFQKHEHLLLNFTEGVNTIIGATDCGKSTIIRAIRWTFYPSELKGNDIRKEGTKKTSVKITIKNPDCIIERIKTATVNSYKSTVNGEEKEYNATGSSLPADIQKIIKFSPIEIDNDKIILNIANQISLPFLLDKSGTFRQKLFNLLTGNDKIDSAMQGLNKDLLQIGREEKFTKQNIEELEVSLGNIKKQKDDTERLTKLFTKQVCEIKLLNDKLTSLKECQLNLNKVDNQLFETKKKMKSIRTVPIEIIKKIKEQIIKFENYITLRKETNKTSKELKIVKESLSKIKIPNIDTKRLIKQSDKLKQLIEWKEKLIEINNNLQSISIKKENCEKEVTQQNSKLKELLGNLKVCPFFKKECPLNKEIK